MIKQTVANATKIRSRWSAQFRSTWSLTIHVRRSTKRLTQYDLNHRKKRINVDNTKNDLNKMARQSVSVSMLPAYPLTGLTILQQQTISMQLQTGYYMLSSWRTKSNVVFYNGNAHSSDSYPQARFNTGNTKIIHNIVISSHICNSIICCNYISSKLK